MYRNARNEKYESPIIYASNFYGQGPEFVCVGTRCPTERFFPCNKLIKTASYLSFHIHNS